LLDTLLVSNHNQLRNINLNLDVLTGRLHLDDPSHVHDRSTDVMSDWLRHKGAALDLRVVKSVVDVVKHHY